MTRSQLLFLSLSGCSYLCGCGASQSRTPASSERPAPTAPTSHPTQHAPSDVSTGPIPVIVTGVLIRRDDHVEICPGATPRPCAGLEVIGDVPETSLSTPNRVVVVRVSGRFDGSKLSASGFEPTSLADAPNYRNRCAEFQQPRAGENASERLSAEVAEVIAAEAARVAGSWWDRETQTMVIAATGDTAELTKRVRARFPRSRICIQPARFSEQELEAARARADGILREGGVVWSSSSIDVVKNQVVYDAEALDAPTLSRLKQEVGDAVRVTAFIQLTENELGRLPAPPQRGDVELVTEQSRSAAAMAALGRFSVHYDAGRRCVYLADAGGDRVLPVWPFGYWATTNPLTVYDYDDRPVAGAGQVVEFGGGGVDIEHVRAPNTCGAKRAWLGAPQNVPNGRRASE